MDLPKLQEKFRTRLCKCPRGPLECLQPDTSLTQYVPPGGEFRTEPQPETEVDLSLQRGRLTLEETVRAMLGKKAKVRDGARLRYTTVQTLRDAEFAVVHTPGMITDGLHVSVVWPADLSLADLRVPWPPAVAVSFSQCFD